MSWGTPEDAVEVVLHAASDDATAAKRSSRRTRLRLLQDSLKPFIPDSFHCTIYFAHVSVL